MPSSPEAVDSLCEQAKARLKSRDIAGAKELYEQAVAQNADHAAAHEALAGLCFATKDYDRAITLYRRLAALNPKRVDSLVNLGAVYNRQENYMEAVKVLRQALSRDRRCAEAYFNLGYAQRCIKQYSMSVSAYKETIRLSPEMPEAYANLGLVLLEMGNQTQAILNFERALQLRPDFERARNGLLKARTQVDNAKKSASPFGRLVNLEEMEVRNRDVNQKFRQLSAQERFEDRSEVHRLSKESEQFASALLNQIRDELSPCILSLSRIVTEERNPKLWIRETSGLNQAVERYHQFLEVMTQKMDALRSHEESIRRP